jgi:hypothetical protein
MFLLDIFTDLARPLWNAQPQIEDSDDEAVGDISFHYSLLLTLLRNKGE